MRVLSVVGNRPQFIKSAPLSLALRAAGIEEVVLHTGQHWDPGMSQVFFDELGIAEPAYRLDLRTADVEAMTGPIADVVAREKPDWVVVFGDTNSTLAGAHAAGAIPIAHVEAGLRSYDMSMPEERTRREVDHMAELLLCPDQHSADELESEGVHRRARIEIVGDVMADATRIFAPLAKETPFEQPYVALTIHRESNTQRSRLREIVDGVAESAYRFVFPIHPRTQQALEEFEIGLPSNVQAVPPLGYLEMLSLVAGATVVVTDSGGLQKEAYWLGVPCRTVRENTEWVDTVRVGANKLIHPWDLADEVEHARFPDDAPVLYGDGHAAERIAAALYA